MTKNTVLANSPNRRNQSPFCDGFSDPFADHLRSFPERQRRNVAEVMRQPHPAWKAQFDKLCARVLQTDGCLIGLLGPRGTGKTQMATSVGFHCGERADNGHPIFRGRTVAMYASLPDLLAKLRATFNSRERDGKTEAGIIDELARPRLLVLDEIHETSGSEWATSLFTNLIDRRYMEMLDTILISNEQQDAFTKSIGSSVASRMQETGGVMICDWPSFRTKLAG